MAWTRQSKSSKRRTDPTTNSSSGSASSLTGYVLPPSLTETFTDRTSNLFTQSVFISVAWALPVLRPSNVSRCVTRTRRPSSMSNSSPTSTRSSLSRVVAASSERSPSLYTTGTVRISGMRIVSEVTFPHSTHLNVPSMVAFPILALKTSCSVSSPQSGHM